MSTWPRFRLEAADWIGAGTLLGRECSPPFLFVTCGHLGSDGIPDPHVHQPHTLGGRLARIEAVSYTHLTLPTILRV